MRYSADGRQDRPSANPLRRWLVPGILLLIPASFFLLFYFYPLSAILRVGLVAEGSINTGALLELFRSEYLLRVLWFTVWQAAVSTVLTLLLAFPGAYVLARFRFRGKSLIRALATLPFVLPTVVVAVAFVSFIGPAGLINSWLQDLFALQAPPIRISQTVWIILLAHIFFNYSVALRLLSAYWQNLSPSMTQAAQMLGASPARAFFEVTLPQLRAPIASAATLIFIYCFTSFGVIVILGGPRFATLEVEIYRQALNLFNLPVAAALSVWQIVFTFILMWVYTRTQSAREESARPAARRFVEKPPRSPREKALVLVNNSAIIVFIGVPLATLVLRSFSGQEGLTLVYYRALFINRDDSLFFVPPGEAIVNSVVIAVVAMVITIAISLMVAQVLTGGERVSRTNARQQPLRNLLDATFMLPLATSAVTLGLGYLVAFGRPPLNFRASPLILPLVHAVVAVPFVLRTVLPGFRGIQPSLREAAGMLGASGWRVWREVDWPLVKRPVLVGALFAFTISLGEFSATIFLSRPETPTMPVAIYRFLGQPGALNYGQALAMSVLLMTVCAIAFLAIEHFRVGDEGGF